MSAASSLPYQLRPNKAVDRELFLALLARVSGSLRIETYAYIGLGGPFLEDFRLIHSRLGITDLVCVEEEEAVHRRQLFNRPAPCVECKHDTLEEFIDSTEFEKPVIIWFDYTDPKKITDQIERFSETVLSVPLNSILRITLNANAGSLGIPKAAEIQTPPDGKKIEGDDRPTLHEWRLARFRERMGTLFPSDTKADDMEKTRYGRALLKVLDVAVSKQILNSLDRTVTWALATHYADGQPMITATLLVLPHGNDVGEIVASWPFYSTPATPLLLDMPVISTRERLTLEAYGGRNEAMAYDLPPSFLADEPYESFKRFYRVFPHFSRVDL